MTLAAPVHAESVPGIAGPSVAPSASEGFQLGGAVARAATPSASIAPLPDSSQLRLSAPRLIRETSETVRRTPFGGLRIYFGEAWNEGDDVFQLGTALTRGQTTAGVSVTYEDDSQDVTSSELYLDYALTDQFSIGVSGILSEDVTSGSTPVPQLGMNAELSTSSGAFLQGGFADSADNDPVFGLAVGMRF